MLHTFFAKLFCHSSLFLESRLLTDKYRSFLRNAVNFFQRGVNMLIKRIVAALSAVLVIATAAPMSAFAAAQDASSWNIKELSESLINTNISSATFDYTVDKPSSVPAAVDVKKFDLRNVDGKNYVTSVKSQEVFSACWAFAATAAAETSIQRKSKSDSSALL